MSPFPGEDWFALLALFQRRNSKLQLQIARDTFWTCRRPRLIVRALFFFIHCSDRFRSGDHDGHEEGCRERDGQREPSRRTVGHVQHDDGQPEANHGSVARPMSRYGVDRSRSRR
jgi:hypothetical protein